MCAWSGGEHGVAGWFSGGRCRLLGRVTLPMRSDLPRYVTAVELMNALERDRTAPLVAEQFGDFLPCPALPTLFADEINVWFKHAVEGPSAAPFRSFACLRVVHGYGTIHPTA